MLLDAVASTVIFVLVGFFFILASIYLFYLTYKYSLYKKESLKESTKYVHGSWKHFWYYNRDKIFVFLALLCLMTGVILIVITV